MYAVLIALAAGNMTGRLLAVNSVNRAELEQHLVSQRVAALQRKLKAEGADEDAIAAEVAAARPQIEAEERRQRPFLSANDRSRWLTIRALVEHGTFEIDDVIDANVWNTIDMVQHRGRDGELHLYSSKPPLLAVLLAGEYWLIRAATGWTLAGQSVRSRAADAADGQRAADAAAARACRAVGRAIRRRPTGAASSSWRRRRWARCSRRLRWC